jgi:hypothetical protein
MELELNHRYLVERFLLGITELKCIDVTKEGCKIQFENGNTLWKEKSRIKHWMLVEDLGLTDFNSITSKAE